MAKSKKFQHKLWRVVKHCRSGAVKWSKAGDSIVFNFSKFQKEYLIPNDDFCKSSNIASFIRQLNLYGFRKLIDLSRNSQPSQDEKEYANPCFLRGRPDLLKEVARKPLKPFMELYVPVKKEVQSDEESDIQVFMEGATSNTERSRNKSSNFSIQRKTELSRQSNRKRKQNKFYIEDDMEELELSKPRTHGWYKTNLFPTITDNDSSPATKKTMIEPPIRIDPLYIAVGSEEESPEPHIHDFIKKDIFPTMPVNNNTSSTRFLKRQIDPITYRIKKELIEETRNPPSEPMDSEGVRKRIKVSPRVEEKYRLDYKVRKEQVEEPKDEDVEIVFETSFRNLSVSSWNDYISNSSPQSRKTSRVCSNGKTDLRKMNLVTGRKRDAKPISIDDLLNKNGIPKFPEEEDVYYDKCLLENSDLDWINRANKDNNFPSSNENQASNSVFKEDIGRKIQLINEAVFEDINNNPKKYSPVEWNKKHRYQPAHKKNSASDINSLCIGLDKQMVLDKMDNHSINLLKEKFHDDRKKSAAESFRMDNPMSLTQKNKSIANQVSLLMSTPSKRSSNPGSSSEIGNRTRVKFLTPRWIDHQTHFPNVKAFLEQNPLPEDTTQKRLEGNQPITDDVVQQICINFDEDDDPFFIHEKAKDILLTQAIGTTRKHNCPRI